MIDCRKHPTKQRYRTRAHAIAGAQQIRKAKGDQYQTLYPYRCPEKPPGGEPHWHLTHHQQGRRQCPKCGQHVVVWQSAVHDKVWIIGAHPPQPGSDLACIGENGWVT